MNRFIFLCLAILLFASCQQNETNVLEDLLYANKDKFGDILKNKDKYEVQIIYTKIDRDTLNTPTFTSYAFNVDTLKYFYPASTVMMPTAFMALEKLNMLYENPNYGKTTMYDRIQIDSARPPQTSVRYDSTAPGYIPTVAHYIKKIFLTSDNDAYNRLYEFIGQNYLNNTLQYRGFPYTKIIHRLEAPAYSVEDNKYTNPIKIFRDDTLIYEQKGYYGLGGASLPLINTLKGEAFTKEDGTKVNQPFDFSNKNFIALSDLNEMLRVVMFAEYVPKEQGFNLTEQDYSYLYKVMSMLPRESKSPTYDSKKYYDSYGKFFMYGDSKEKIPDNIRIFNKVGWAYGYLTDCAYIVDFENNVEFMLTAVIHVNENQTYNDGVYEYETIGLPFFANLGKVIYNYERKRKRKVKPNLDRYKMKYD